jgi:hypothetical protein
MLKFVCNSGGFTGKDAMRFYDTSFRTGKVSNERKQIKLLLVLFFSKHI